MEAADESKRRGGVPVRIQEGARRDIWTAGAEARSARPATWRDGRNESATPLWLGAACQYPEWLNVSRSSSPEFCAGRHQEVLRDTLKRELEPAADPPIFSKNWRGVGDRHGVVALELNYASNVFDLRNVHIRHAQTAIGSGSGGPAVNL